MFQDRIGLILDKLNVRNKDIAEYADTSPVTIGRYRMGKRIPKKEKPAVHRLVDGLIQYAEEHGKSDVICRLLEADGLAIETPAPESLAPESLAAYKANAAKQLHAWLYADTPDGSDHSNKKKSSAKPFSAFAEKLGEAMNLAELSNSTLAHMINADPSMISRFRRGHRTPKSSSGALILICRVLVERITELGKTDELIRMTGAPQEAAGNGDVLLVCFQKWLCDFAQEDHTSIIQLLQSMDTFSPAAGIPLLSCESIATQAVADDCRAYYTGTEGLQNAVIRFLITAISCKARELLLYSDQDMNWMVKNRDFDLKWLSLMSECVKQGIRIKIIHNIERSTNEMINAIRSWLPLYMSGMVEPYYCTLRNGQRFSHTIFLCPGVACIEAGIINGSSEDGLYNYYTDKPHLDYYESSYSHLLHSCRMLMRMETAAPPAKNDSTFFSDQYTNIGITLTRTSVHISMTEPPYLSFTFLHPLMCEAFRAYVRSINCV